MERMNSISSMMKNASRDMIPRDMFPVNSFILIPFLSEMDPRTGPMNAHINVAMDAAYPQNARDGDRGFGDG